MTQFQLSCGEMFLAGLLLVIFLAGAWQVGSLVIGVLHVTGWMTWGVYALTTWCCAWVFLEVLSA